jgi:pimeloyl-ACP methyl ester carboxylesterase
MNGGYLSKSGISVVFSHGKESGPWGSKITAMAQVAQALQFDVLSVDYRGIDEPLLRVEKLVRAVSALSAPPVLVGSSMGGYVSAAAVSRVRVRAIFLLAPAFYMPGFEQYTPQDVAVPTAIVHGWHDDIVPVDNSVRWAREHHATLHVLNSNHRLEDQIAAISSLLRDFLTTLA